MYGRIMVPLDGSAFSERALPMAVSLARKTGGWLQLARCSSAGGLPADTTTAQQAREAADAKAYLSSVADWIAQQGIDVTTSVPRTPPVEGLTTEARLHKTDLIVMGTHGHSGLGRWIYGSVAEGIVACAECPVILVRPTGPLASLGPKPERVGLLVPLDGSCFAEAALPHLWRLAIGLTLLAAYQLLLDRYWLPLVLGSTHGGPPGALGWAAMLILAGTLSRVAQWLERRGVVISL